MLWFRIHWALKMAALVYLESPVISAKRADVLEVTVRILHLIPRTLERTWYTAWVLAQLWIILDWQDTNSFSHPVVMELILWSSEVGLCTVSLSQDPWLIRKQGLTQKTPPAMVADGFALLVPQTWCIIEVLTAFALSRELEILVGITSRGSLSLGDNAKSLKVGGLIK